LPSSDANVRGASACAANANPVVCSTSIDMLEKLVPSYLRAALCVSLTLSQTTHIFKKEFPNCAKRSRERAKNAQLSLLPAQPQHRRNNAIVAQLGRNNGGTTQSLSKSPQQSRNDLNPQKERTAGARYPGGSSHAAGVQRFAITPNPCRWNRSRR